MNMESTTGMWGLITWHSTLACQLSQLLLCLFLVQVTSEPFKMMGIKKANKDWMDEVTYSRSRFSRRLSQHREKYRDNLVRTKILHARRRNATCMDGSDAQYYLSRQRNSLNWVIHLQGGGSCLTLDECREKAKGPLGSSLLLSDTITGEYTLSNDPNINPTFSRWNKVLIPYCSGDVFVGRKQKKNHPFRIPMLGHYIVTAVIEDLIKKHNLITKYSEVLFGGTSAGGIGVLANIDHVQRLTYPATVKGYNDGGWFTLYPNYGEMTAGEGPLIKGVPKFYNTFVKMFEHKWDGFVDVTCRKNMPQAAACLYGELAIKYIKAPMYVMVSQWDSFQMTSMVSSEYKAVDMPPRSPRETKFVSRFGNNTYRSVTRLLNHKHTGVYSPACFSHTFLTSCIDGITCGGPREQTTRVKETSAYKALSEWYRSDGKKGSYVDIPSKYPSCNPSCCTEHCSLCMQPKTVTKQSINNNKVSSRGRKSRTKSPSIENNNVDGVLPTLTSIYDSNSSSDSVTIHSYCPTKWLRFLTIFLASICLLVTNNGFTDR